jgi:hypothetical protein
MNDPSIPTPPAATTAPAPGTAVEIARLLSAGTIDATQAGRLAKAGNVSTLHVAQALHALPAAPSLPAPAPAPAAAPIPTSSAPIVSGPQTELTGAEAAKVAQWAREDLLAGKISQGQADKIFDDLAVPMEQRIVTEETPRSDEQRWLDTHFPAGQPRDYHIAYFRPGEKEEMTPELQQFDQSARTWLSGAEFPANLGNSLITNIEKVAQTTKGMTPEQLVSYGEGEYVKLQRVYGDTLDDKLRAAGRMVEALDAKTPGLKNLLKSKGLGDNAMIASLLIQQAERYWARRKGR